MTTIVKIGGVHRVIETESLHDNRFGGCSKTPLSESYPHKIGRFLNNPVSVNYVCREAGLQNGETLQLQNPTQKGYYILDCGGESSVHQYLDDVLLTVGETKGCFTYVATLNESKNSGQYQRRALRVKESATYLVRRWANGHYRLELLLDNKDWLSLKKSQKAVKKLVAYRNLSCKPDDVLEEASALETRKCTLYLSGTKLELRICRVQAFENSHGRKMFVVVSMNSGKIWVLDEDKVVLEEDISLRKTVMTNFVRLHQEGLGDYVIEV